MSFLNKINPLNIPASIKKDDDLLVLRERILQATLLVGVPLGGVALILNIFPLINSRSWAVMALFIGAYMGILALTYYREISYRTRAHALLLVLYLLGISELLQSGLSGSGRVFLLTYVIFSSIMLGWQTGIFAGIIGIATLGIIGGLMSVGTIPLPPLELMATSGNGIEWLIGGITLVLLVALLIASLAFLISGLQSNLLRQKELTKIIDEDREQLEIRVAERTAEMETRAGQLEAASQIAREISALSGLESLLSTTAEIIKIRLEVDHVGIFLCDDINEYAVLMAATGEAGRKMLENNHKLKISEVGLVGRVAGSGEPLISLDVDFEEKHFKNPFLPDTQSEIALPLKSGEKISGVLDIQSNRENAFSNPDIKFMQIIADQLAVAIDKAMLLKQIQKNLEDVESTYQRYTRKAWQTHLRAGKQKYAYRINKQRIEEDAPESKEVRDVLASGTIHQALQVESNGSTQKQILAIPIKLRNQVLGVLDIRFESPSIPRDLIDMLSATTDHLALALESARLIEEIQTRAEREKMVAQMASRVSSSPDLESILRTAAIEIGRNMGVSEVVVQLRSSHPEEISGTSGGLNDSQIR